MFWLLILLIAAYAAVYLVFGTLLLVSTKVVLVLIIACSGFLAIHVKSFENDRLEKRKGR